MAQHNYTITNDSGAAVRADLNYALSAIATANSGPTAPTTTHPYQLWADTANTKLRIRNGANSAWIEIGDLDDVNLGLMLASRFPNLTGNVTASHTELNKLDGCNASTTEINLLYGVTNIVQSLEAVYPVGSIYMNASVSTNPATLLGFGNWSRFGKGRVLVSQNSGDSEFNSIGETGGSKTHQLSEPEMPSHKHDTRIRNEYKSVISNSSTATYSTGDANDGKTGADGWSGLTSASGDNEAHNNLQPYITVYMWVRDND